MEKADAGVFYAANLGLIHSISRKCYGRLQGIGAPMPYDDIVQELSIVLLKCHTLHDPEKGSKFSTYFTSAAYNRINRIAEEYEEERVKHGTRSVQEMFSGGEEDVGEDFDCVPCERNTPEEEYVAKETMREITSKLSPLATLIVEWLVNPPEFVLDELEKVVAHSEYAKSLGYNKRSTAKLNVAFICEVVMLVSNVTTVEVGAARQELRSVIEGKYGRSC